MKECKSVIVVFFCGPDVFLQSQVPSESFLQKEMRDGMSGVVSLSIGVTSQHKPTNVPNTFIFANLSLHDILCRLKIKSYRLYVMFSESITDSHLQSVSAEWFVLLQVFHSRFFYKSQGEFGRNVEKIPESSQQCDCRACFGILGHDFLLWWNRRRLSPTCCPRLLVHSL